jgi:hypothetical protein
MSQYGVAPGTGDSPLNIGTMTRDTWFLGAIGKVAIYDYLLSQKQIADHFAIMTSAAESSPSNALPAPTYEVVPARAAG